MEKNGSNMDQPLVVEDDQELDRDRPYRVPLMKDVETPEDIAIPRIMWQVLETRSEWIPPAIAQQGHWGIVRQCAKAWIKTLIAGYLADQNAGIERACQFKRTHFMFIECIKEIFGSSESESHWSLFHKANLYLSWVAEGFQTPQMKITAKHLVRVGQMLAYLTWFDYFICENDIGVFDGYTLKTGLDGVNFLFLTKLAGHRFMYLPDATAFFTPAKNDLDLRIKEYSNLRQTEMDCDGIRHLIEDLLSSDLPDMRVEDIE